MREDAMTSLCPTGISAIVVSVLFRDAIVRAGVAATLMTDPELLVHVVPVGSGLDPDASLWPVLAGVHVVVADYDNALAVARMLRGQVSSHGPESPKLLIVSPRDGEADVRRALESGIQGYLPLDCEPQEMTEGVTALHRGMRCLGRTVTQRVAESFDYQALTSRETQVLRCVVAGDSNKIVARKLDIAVGTVKVHVRSIMSKLGARTRTEAAAVAQRRGLLWGESQAQDVAAMPLPPHPVESHVHAQRPRPCLAA